MVQRRHAGGLAAAAVGMSEFAIIDREDVEMADVAQDLKETRCRSGIGRVARRLRRWRDSSTPLLSISVQAAASGPCGAATAFLSICQNLPGAGHHQARRRARVQGTDGSELNQQGSEAT